MQTKYYTTALLTLTKLFVNDEITLDEYNYSLHELCQSYRKDKGIVYEFPSSSVKRCQR